MRPAGMTPRDGMGRGRATAVTLITVVAALVAAPAVAASTVDEVVGEVVGELEGVGVVYGAYASSDGSRVLVRGKGTGGDPATLRLLSRLQPVDLQWRPANTHVVRRFGQAVAP